MQEKIIYGVYDGKNMLADDTSIYPVPPNYASKSKLIDGDSLKLTISEKGEFIYKHIGRVDRIRVFAVLVVMEFGGEIKARVDNKLYSIPVAALNYFKLKAGDKIIGMIEKNGDCEWMAVEGCVN